MTDINSIVESMIRKPPYKDEDFDSAWNTALWALLDELHETGLNIENEYEEKDHTLYGYDGVPLRTLDCSCGKCLDYFLSNGGT